MSALVLTPNAFKEFKAAVVRSIRAQSFRDSAPFSLYGAMESDFYYGIYVEETEHGTGGICTPFVSYDNDGNQVDEPHGLSPEEIEEAFELVRGLCGIAKPTYKVTTREQKVYENGSSVTVYQIDLYGTDVEWKTRVFRDKGYFERTLNAFKDAGFKEAEKETVFENTCAESRALSLSHPEYTYFVSLSDTGVTMSTTRFDDSVDSFLAELMEDPHATERRAYRNGQEVMKA